MARVEARVLYKSGRMFRKGSLYKGINISCQREDRPSHSRFVIKTWNTFHDRPSRKHDGFSVVIEQETMEEIVREYNRLFKN